MPMIAVNNAHFYYELHGQGKPVILVAGYTCDYLTWTPILDQLSQSFRVLIFDNRGVGQTRDDGKPFSAATMAQDVVALAEALGLEKPHLVGQSMGGTIVQAVASRYPEKIDRVCILSSSAKWRLAMLLMIKSQLIMREKNVDLDLILDNVIPWVCGSAYLSHPENITTFKRLIIDNPYPQSLDDQKRQYQVLEQFDGRSALKKIKAPTLVVHGIQDILSLGYESEFLVQHIPNAQLLKFDCAHTIIREIPQQITQALTQFLS